jgi:transcriptional regulator with XRE-family HTH domain
MGKRELNRLKIVLAEKDKTARWLSEQMGVEPCVVRWWSNNYGQPSLERLMKISKILDVPIMDLIRIPDDLYKKEKTKINRLKIVLLEKKKTGRWLSEQLGVFYVTVSEWCNNHAQPPIESLIRISKILDVPIMELLSIPYDPSNVPIHISSEIKMPQNRIKIVLKEKRKSTSWLAKQMGINRCTISRWAANHYQPPLQKLIEISKILDVPLMDIIVIPEDL